MPDVPWFVYAMLLAPLGLILVAAVYKTWQVRAAREWPSTPGKVVISNAELRDVTVMDSDREDGRKVEQRNFANIVYEYSVAGKKLRNNRVSIGEDLGNFQVAETIAKYPAGDIVMVYYNPLHPHQAVLERDLPKGMWGCLGIGTAIVLAIVFGSAIGLQRLTEFFSTRLADPNVAPGGRARRLRICRRAFRARPAAAGIAGQEMAGGAGHDQAFRPRAIPRRAGTRTGARPDHVSAQGILRLPLQRYRLYQPASHASPATSRRPRAG